jgi:hypothetical protein
LSLVQVAVKYKKRKCCVQDSFAKLKRVKGDVLLSDVNINLIFDGVYFGGGVCYLVFRANGQNITTNA